LDFFQYDAQVLPCAVIEGVTDAMLFGQVLAPGERSAVFRSASQVLGEYGAHAVHFFYVHVGSEIARVEAPEWVVESPDLLERVHAVVVDQAEKGGGYPLALIEAHEKAVVRSAEREAFFRLLEEMLVRKGLPGAISSKGWSKRTPRI
jgi:NurA-like 5'-3' nuclease